jgi:CO/xanthine dehydrogenase FAD-binding subunit
MIIPYEFTFLKPKELKEALRFLNKYGERASLLAGGTDLIVNMKYRSILQLTPGAGTPAAKYPAAKNVSPMHNPEVIISLNNLAELKGIKKNKSHLLMGPTTTMTEISTCRDFPPAAGALRDAASCMGTPLIRNRATIGGNLANARPAADGAVALIALRSNLKIQNFRETRWIPSSQFISAPGCTTIQRNELISGIEIPLGPNQGSAYLRQGMRRQMEIAITGSAVWVRLHRGSDTIADACICLGAVGPIPILALQAAEELKGQQANEKVISHIAAVAQKEAKPIDDFRGSADYRLELVEVLTRRAIRLAVKRAQYRSDK